MINSDNETIVDTGIHTQLLQEVGAVAEGSGIEAYAVGGFVRDLLLERPSDEIDFVTIGPGSGIDLAERVAERLGSKLVSVYRRFGTAAVSVPGGTRGSARLLEFVAARTESYRSDSRKPIVEDGSLEDDQLRRDFTINAMAIVLSEGGFGRLLDPFDGRGDLERRMLRTPREPGQTFEDDPLRIVRAARFASQLGFGVEEETLRAMRSKAPRVKILSQERITDEFQKIMASRSPSVGIALLHVTDALEQFFPELEALQGVETIGGQAHKDNFYHTLQVLDNVIKATSDRDAEETLWLRWAALLHDIAKPRSKRFAAGAGWTFHGHEDRGARMVPKLFRRLRLPTDDRMRYVQQLVKLHHRPVALVDDTVTDSAVRRLLFDAGDAIDDLMTLVRADITSKNPQRVRRYLSAFDSVEEKMVEVEEKDRLRDFQPPVDGNEIMQILDLQPGRVVGDIKEAIREAILDGRIPNEHDAAYDFMMRIKDEMLGKANASASAGNESGPRRSDSSS